MIAFSIVIPAFNAGIYINNTIDSILKQSYQNWEIIVVDNSSQDNTVEIVKAYCDSRIRVINTNNYGVIANSRNIGIQNAKFEWVAFIDADDLWYEEKLSEVVNAIKKSSASLFFHDMDICDNKGVLLKKNIRGRLLKNDQLKDLLINGNCISNSSVVVKRKTLEEIKYINSSKEMVGAEDYNTWLKIASQKKRIEYIPLSLGIYREHEHGVSKKDMSKVMKEAVSEFEKVLSKEEKRKLNSRILYTKIKFLYDKNNQKLSFSDFIFCFSYGSFDIKFKTLFLFIKFW